jgi:hypothetical protein
VPAKARAHTFGVDAVNAQGKDPRHPQSDTASVPGDSAPLLDYNTTYKGVQTIEMQLGATPEEAGASARQVVQIIEEVTRYPQSVPKAKSTDQIRDMLTELINLLGEDE